MKRESERGGHAWVMRNAVEPNHLILSSDLAFRRVIYGGTRYTTRRCHAAGWCEGQPSRWCGRCG